MLSVTDCVLSLLSLLLLYFLDYKPEYSIIELGVDEISLEPSSTMRRLFMKPGNEPGPDGDGK